MDPTDAGTKPAYAEPKAQRKLIKLFVSTEQKKKRKSAQEVRSTNEKMGRKPVSVTFLPAEQINGSFVKMAHAILLLLF